MWYHYPALETGRGMKKLAFTILALLVVAVPVTLFVSEAWPRMRHGSAPGDATRAPEWLRQLTRVEPGLWRPWTEIVIHHSAGELGDLESIDRYHRNMRHWDSAGYDFIIGNGTFSGDGEIEVSTRWETQSDGAHCTGHNTTAIGICLVGNFQAPGERPSPAQDLSLVQLVACLAVRYNIPADHIYLHREIHGASTLCPGANFPEDNIRKVVEKLRAEYAPAKPAAAKR